MQWYLKCWKQYADFKGRARRKEYWMFTLFNCLAIIVLAILGSLILKEKAGILLGLYILAVLIPSLAVLCRRLHDIGKKGTWIFIALIPLVGSIWLLVLLCIAGTEDNAFGPNPKAGTAEA